MKTQESIFQVFVRISSKLLASNPSSLSPSSSQLISFFFLFNPRFSKSCFIFYPMSPTFSIYIVRQIPSKHREVKPLVGVLNSIEFTYI